MSFFNLLWFPVGFVLKGMEQLLYVLINVYDAYCYAPLQTALSPVVAKIPRTVVVRGRHVTVFTANIVSWSRTALVIPIAWCLKYNQPVVAFACVLFHDFLDHLDGIVAKVHKQTYGQIDDPLLGGFMDAFCDKIVNCVSLWTILVVTDFSHMTTSQTCLLFGACAVIVTYEFILGVVRVQDYFKAFYARKYASTSSETSSNIAAVMEGKLKEKLESMGIGCLCLAQGSMVPMEATSGIIGVVCLLLSVRLAHASLQHKLKSRHDKKDDAENEPSCSTVLPTEENAPISLSVGTQCILLSEQTLSRSMLTLVTLYNKLTVRETRIIFAIKTDVSPNIYVNIINKHPDEWSSYNLDKTSVFDDDLSDIEEASTDEKSDMSEKEEEEETKTNRILTRSQSVPTWNVAHKVDKVYSVGCFDLFHEGHVKLLSRLRNIGIQVIVGVHDSRSIFKLKKRVPIDDTSKRMANVKKHADVVFCVHGTDPTPYLQCMVDVTEKVTSMYVRGDDMPNFPARDFTEKIMPVQFLPYTTTVSSTKLRKEIYNSSKFGPHVQHDSMFY